MKGLRMIVAILSGNAIVLVKRDEKKADVMIGKGVNRKYAINSMVGAVKAMML